MRLQAAYRRAQGAFPGLAVRICPLMGSGRPRREPSGCLPDAPLAGADVATAALGTRAKGRPTGGPPALPERARRGRTIFGAIDPELAAVELAPVQLLDGGRGLLGRGQLYEREPPRATAVAVGRDRYGQHLADRREELAELILSGVEAQIADEPFV